VAFLPFVPVRLKALKPEPIDEHGDALSAHLRRRRRELGLFRKQAAERMRVKEWTLLKWETGAALPLVSFYPRIIAFLGYEPWPEPRTLAEMPLAKRRREGRSGREAALLMGVDQATYIRMEAGQIPGRHHVRDIVTRFKPIAPLPPLSEGALRSPCGARGGRARIGRFDRGRTGPVSWAHLA